MNCLFILALFQFWYELWSNIHVYFCTEIITGVVKDIIICLFIVYGIVIVDCFINQKEYCSVCSGQEQEKIKSNSEKKERQKEKQEVWRILVNFFLY